MPRVLVVATGSLNLPHRKPYDSLGRQPGWEVHLLAPNKLYKACAPAPPGAAYELHTSPVRLYNQGRLTLFTALGSVVRRVRPDVIFVEWDPGSAIAIHAALAARRPVVAFTVENIERDRLADAREHARSLRLREAARDLLVAGLEVAGRRAVSAVACINREGQRIFREGGHFGDAIELVPLGTDTDLFRPMDASEMRTKLGLGDAFVVGYFGRIVPEKGVHLIVEALASLPKNVRLLLDMYQHFEPGSYGASLMDRAKELGVLDRIITIDVPHEDVARYMNCCDTIVLPSLSTERWKEQFGRVLPEAMACEVAVIGSNSGNIPDMIGDAGLVVEEGSAAAIAAGVRRLNDAPGLRRELGARGRQRVIDQFSVEVQVQRMKSLLSRAISR